MKGEPQDWAKRKRSTVDVLKLVPGEKIAAMTVDRLSPSIGQFIIA